MAGLSTILTKGFKAEAAVPARRIVKHGATDGAVLVGATSLDKIFGVSAEIPAALGEPCDVHLYGVAEVEYGGNVARGDYLTSDGTGRAIAAAPAAGVNAAIIGQALVSGVAGDIGVTVLHPSRIQG